MKSKQVIGENKSKAFFLVKNAEFQETKLYPYGSLEFLGLSYPGLLSLLIFHLCLERNTADATKELYVQMTSLCSPPLLPCRQTLGLLNKHCLGNVSCGRLRGQGCSMWGRQGGRNSILQIHGEVGNVSLAQAHSWAVFGGSRNSPINPGSAAV